MVFAGGRGPAWPETISITHLTPVSRTLAAPLSLHILHLRPVCRYVFVHLSCRRVFSLSTSNFEPNAKACYNFVKCV